jgi:hypothetical protein
MAHPALTAVVERQPTVRWPPKDGQPALRRTVRRRQYSNEDRAAQLRRNTVRLCERAETVAVERQPTARWPPKDGQPALRAKVRRWQAFMFEEPKFDAKAARE